MIHAVGQRFERHRHFAAHEWSACQPGYGIGLRSEDVTARRLASPMRSFI
jgi:hypothetical protein